MQFSSLKNSHWPITLLSSLSSLLNMLLPMIMARVLSPLEVGQFRIFFLYLTVLPSISLTVGVVNGIYYWAAKERKSIHLIQTAWSLLLAHAFSVAVIIAMILMVARTHQYNIFQELPTKGRFFFLLAAIPTILLNFFDFAVIALGRVWQGALFSSIFEILRTFCLLLIMQKTKSLTFVLFAHVAITYVRVLVGSYLGLRQGIFKVHLKPDPATVRELLKYAAPVSMAAAFDVFIGSSDRLILSSFLPPSEYATYAIGCLSIPPLLILEQSVNKVLIPKLAKALDNQNLTLAVSLYRENMKELAKIYIPAVTGLILFAEPIISLLFTPRYQFAARYLRVYALTYLFFGIPYDALARASGDGKWILRNCVLFGLLSLLIVFELSSHYGAYGALAGSLFCQLSLRLFSLNEVRFRLGSKWSELIPLQPILFYSTLSLILACACVAAKLVCPNDRIWFLTTGSLFCAIYFLCIAGFQPITRRLGFEPAQSS